MFTRALLKSSQAVLLLAAGIFIGAAISSFAGPQVEVMAGYFHSQRAPDGVWHESQFAEHNKVNAVGGQIGLRFASDTWGIRLAATDFGHTSSDAHAVNDEYTANDVKMGRLSCEPHPSTRGCISQWKGEGGRYGVSAGVFRAFNVRGWTVSPEVGLIRYTYWWSDTVSQFQSNENEVTISERSTATASYLALGLQRSWFVGRIEYAPHLKGGIAQGSAVSVFLGAAINL